MSPWRTARRIAEGWTFAVLLTLALAWSFSRTAQIPPWLPVLGVWGLVLPAVGWRYYQYRRESGARRPYLMTVGTIFSVAGLTALVSCAAFFWTGAPAVLTGVAGYLLLAGLLWPNEFRCEEFESRDEDGVSG